MERKIRWKWKSTTIDFDALGEEMIEGSDYITKKEYLFHFLGIPDHIVHTWRNGEYSTEYNIALNYARQLDLIRELRDDEDE